jgi:hypothetical protein
MSKQMKYKGSEIPIRLIVWFLVISPEGDVLYSVAEEEYYGKNLSAGFYKETLLAEVFNSVEIRLETDVSNYGHYLLSG